MNNTRFKNFRFDKVIMEENLDMLYPHNVLLYNVPPTSNITLQEFEDIALERLKVFRILEDVSKSSVRIYSDEWKEKIINELNQENLKNYVRLIQGVGKAKKELEMVARKRDYISHFILRMVYCRTADLKRWFIQREMELFRLKFTTLATNQIRDFLAINNLEYIPLTLEQKNMIKEGLYDSTMGLSVTKIENSEFYKIKFMEVYDLVKSRRCFVKKGYAYITTNDFVSIIGNKQHMIISNGLEAASHLLPYIGNDQRVLNLLKGLHTSYTGKDYALNKTDVIRLEDLDKLSKKSYPICMRHCHDTIRSKHHLKHFGRMQFGLFLKGIGVTLNDSIEFWRQEFTKLIDNEKFDKQYLYNIQHNYGKVGSMVNYTPYSCNKIISASSGADSGCPFKMFDTYNLKEKLTTYGINSSSIQDIIGYTSKGHYQLACGKYFEFIHEKKIEQGIQHPNQYFELSQFIMGNRAPSSSSNSVKRTSTGHQKNTAKQLLNDNYDNDLWNITESEEKNYDDTINATMLNYDIDLNHINYTQDF